MSYFRTDSGLCIYHLLIWSNFNLLHSSQWITFPIQSCLLLLCEFSGLAYYMINHFIWLHTLANLLHIINFHWYNWFFWHYFVLLLRDSVSFIRFPFLSHVQTSHVQFHQFVIWSIHTIGFLPIYYYYYYLFFPFFCFFHSIPFH